VNRFEPLRASSSLAQPLSHPAWRVTRRLPGDTLQDIFALRREVYFNEQGLAQDHDTRVSDLLDSAATHVCVSRDLELAGALRLTDVAQPCVLETWGTSLALERFSDAFTPEAISVGSRLVVLLEQRRRDVLDRLMAEAYKRCLERGTRFGLISCVPSLGPLFEHYGFREYLPPLVQSNGEVLLRMAMVCEDADHFDACGSNLLGLVRNAAVGRQARDWLQQAFPTLH
jgi:predicted GNAT family N-acyltransferase